MARIRKPSGWNKPKSQSGEKPGSGSSSPRDLKQRVKTARGRKVSSTNWLKRQLNDPYVGLAKKRRLPLPFSFQVVRDR